MTETDDTTTAMDFRLGPKGEFALRVGDAATAEWYVGRFAAPFTPAADESVEDWFKLVPADLVGMFAHRVQADLAKVETAASRLGEAHDEVVQELRDKIDALDRQVQAAREFILELGGNPFTEAIGRDLRQRLDEAEES